MLEAKKTGFHGSLFFRLLLEAKTCILLDIDASFKQALKQLYHIIHMLLQLELLHAPCCAFFFFPQICIHTA